MKPGKANKKPKEKECTFKTQTIIELQDHMETKKKIPTQDLNRKLRVQLIVEMKRSKSSRGESEREVDEKVR